MSAKSGNYLVYRRDGERKAATRAAVAAPSSGKGTIRVGVCDLDTCAGALPALLSRMEKVQDRFAFFSVEAPWQTGLTFPGPHVAAEWREHTGATMPRDAAAANVSAQRLFAAARPVLKTLPVDRLVLIVQSMICDVAGDDATYNLFSTVSGKIALVSTYGLRDYAAKAGRPFEAAVFQGMLSALLAMLVPKVGYVEETAGSIFDYCENRADVVRSIRNPTIDADNRAVIPARLLQPAEQLLDALKSYDGHVSKPKRGASAKRAIARAPSDATAATSASDDGRNFSDILGSLAHFAKK